MKKCKFKIFVVSSILPTGDILPQNDVYDCEFWADKTVDIIEYGQKIYSFWLQSNPLGNARDSWTYDWHIEQV